MSSIYDLLAQIKNAVYGKDVRDAIHDSIEQCYKDATGNPDSVSALIEKLFNGVIGGVGDVVYGVNNMQTTINVESLTETEINSLYLQPGTWIIIYNLFFTPSSEQYDIGLEATIRKNDSSRLNILQDSKSIITCGYNRSISINCSVVTVIEADDASLIVDSNPAINGTKVFYLYLSQTGDNTASVKSAFTAVRLKTNSDGDETSLAEQVAQNTADISLLNEEVTDVKEDLGDLDDLQTIVKTDLVSAINEAAQSGGGSGGSPKGVTLANQMIDTNENYLYLGNETGYEYGYIYVYLNDAWTKTTLYGKGQSGEDGFSPLVTVEQASDGVNISVTDKDGTTVATVQNGTATDEQVDAWLTAHPEATTTVQDNSVTPNKTTFIEEPYYYDIQTVNRNSDYSDLVSIDLTENNFIVIAVPNTGSLAIRDRWLLLYKDGTQVTHKGATMNDGPDNLNGWTIKYFDLSSVDASTVNQWRVRTLNSTSAVVYYTYEHPSAYTYQELFKTTFDFREGYKDKFSEALEIGTDGSVTTDVLADNAVINRKIADKTIQPRKLSNCTNLLEQENILFGKYLGGNGFLPYDAKYSCTAFIPVEPGKTYTVNFVPENFRFYGFYATKDGSTNPIGGVNYSASASSDPYSITVPDNSNIKYLAISSHSTSTPLSSRIYKYGGTVLNWEVWESTDTQPPMEYAFEWLKLGKQSKVLSSIFRDKVVIATGDSITENNTRNDNKSWCMYLPEYLGVKVYNDGKSGTGLVKNMQSYHSLLYRVERLWDTAYAGVTPDLVLFMGNMNDGTGTGETSGLNDLGISGWSGSGVLAVGTPSDDINTQSVYGCAKRVLEDIITKYPSAQIGWILSTPRSQTISYWTGKENCYGHGWFEDYITASKYQCEQYNVPVLDLYHESGFRPTNQTNMDTYMDDGSTHPNTAGLKKYMVDPIVRWIEQKFGEVT